MAEVTTRQCATTADTQLRRELSARQITMVAVGGSIGTGLLLGSGDRITIRHRAGKNIPGRGYIALNRAQAPIAIDLRAIGACQRGAENYNENAEGESYTFGQEKQTELLLE